MTVLITVAFVGSFDFPLKREEWEKLYSQIAKKTNNSDWGGFNVLVHFNGDFNEHNNCIQTINCLFFLCFAFFCVHITVCINYRTRWYAVDFRVMRNFALIASSSVLDKNFMAHCLWLIICLVMAACLKRRC